MWLGSTTVVKLAREVDGPVEVQGTVVLNIDVQRLVVARSIENADVSGLNEVVGDNKVLLIWSELEVVRSESWLILVWVVEALDVVQVGDVEGGDVVCGGEGDCEVSEGLLANVVGNNVTYSMHICRPW